MRCKIFLAVVLVISLIHFVPAPHLLEVSWNQTEALEGQPVKLIVEGEGLDGHPVSFQIFERDEGGIDTRILNPPANIIYESETSDYYSFDYATWNAVWQDDAQGSETNPPEYYFIARVADRPPDSYTRMQSSTLYDDMLKVYKLGGSGAIWTTKGDCGDSSQDVNHFARGELVYINGAGFSPGIYLWNITGNPGGSSGDPGISVASGMHSVDETGTFCFRAYMVALDDWGEYNVGFGDKNDNYRVDPGLPPIFCGDTICNNGETCETCSQDCEVCPPVCGNGITENGEECDDYNTVSNDGCSSTCKSEHCGDWIKQINEECDDGNTVSGDGCSSTCTDEINPSECILDSLSWNQTTAFGGDPILINIDGQDCNGEILLFEVFEKDGFLNGDDPVNINPEPIIFSPGSYGTWTAEWQDDNEGPLSEETNPPEYYFVVIINSTGEPIKSSDEEKDMLKVFRKEVFCFGINYCSNYLTQADCEADLCNVGPNSIPADIICGRTFNKITGCYEDRDCRCGWNYNLGVCEGKWDLKETCEEEERLLGKCSYEENNEDTCEDDGWLVRSLYANWMWEINNYYPEIPAGENADNYIPDLILTNPQIFRYDPNRESLNCIDKEETFVCPPQVQLPFFGFYQLIITIAIVVLIYFIYPLKKKKLI